MSLMNRYSPRPDSIQLSISSEDIVMEYTPEPPQSIEEEQVPRTGKYFPWAHILEVSLSEPRDVLQSERTFLTFIRFSVSLYFTAIGMILGFRLQSVNALVNHTNPNFNKNAFNHAISYLLIFLSFAILLICSLNYFKTVRRYSQKRIHTYAASNRAMVICVTAIVVTLIAINVLMIVERYTQES